MILLAVVVLQVMWLGRDEYGKLIFRSIDRIEGVQYTSPKKNVGLLLKERQ